MVTFVYNSIRQLQVLLWHRRYLKSATWEGDIHKINETFEKLYLLIGLSKFAQTFAVRFLKSSSNHPICINAWEASPLSTYMCNHATCLLWQIDPRFIRVASNKFDYKIVYIWHMKSSKRACLSSTSFINESNSWVCGIIIPISTLFARLFEIYM